MCKHNEFHRGELQSIFDVMLEMLQRVKELFHKLTAKNTLKVHLVIQMMIYDERYYTLDNQFKMKSR